MTVERPILIVGLPRSGTTWTVRIFASAQGTVRVSEPDNEDKYPSALHAKRRVGRYPVLVPDDRAPEYRRLWEWALSGGREGRREAFARRLLGPGEADRIHDGRRDPVTWAATVLARDPRPLPGGVGARVVSKSIHAQLCVEWLASEFDVDALLLLRHPANVLASWMEVNLKDSRNTTLESRPEVRARYVERWGVPLPGPDPVEQMCWRIALLTAAIEEAASRNPTWKVRVHEDLCTDPVDEFRRLFADFGLEWSPEVAEFIQGHDAPGTGFMVKRVAAELGDVWRKKLEPDQVATLRRVLGWFPISTWGDSDFELEA